MRDVCKSQATPQRIGNVDWKPIASAKDIRWLHAEPKVRQVDIDICAASKVRLKTKKNIPFAVLGAFTHRHIAWADRLWSQLHLPKLMQPGVFIPSNTTRIKP
jgi:hypothetical protein